MTNHLTRVLGIGAALAVPAIAVGALTIPHSFEGGQQLSAAALNENFVAIRTEFAAQQTLIGGLQTQVETLQDQVETLEDTVAELEERKPGSEYTTLTVNVPDVPISTIVLGTPTRVWLAQAPGILVAIPAGSGYQNVEARIWLGNPGSSLECTGNSACSSIGRTQTAGENLTVAIPANTHFTVTGVFPAGNGAGVLVHYFPLTGDGLPTLVY